MTTSVSISTKTAVDQLYVGDSDFSYVDLGYISSGEYTWATADFAWNNLTWNTAKLTTWAIEVCESIAMSETYSGIPKKIFNSSFGVSDAPPFKRFQKAIVEGLNLCESYSDSIAFVLRFFEALSVENTPAIKSRKKFNSLIQVTESLFEKRFSLNPEEFLSLVDSFGRVTAFKLAMAEGFSISDALDRTTRLQISESLSLLEEYVRRANGTISDVIIDSGDLSLEEFTKIVTAGHAPGYTDFRNYIPGDYEFQYAIIRTILESSSGDRAVLNELSLNVDVPDVFDRGSVVITPEIALDGLRVDFNRAFHIIPEITLTLKGGTVVAIPKSLHPDRLGFTAILLDPSTGNGVPGTLTWAAHGY